MYELAKATGAQQEGLLLHAAATDNKSNDLLYDSLWVIFQFIVGIEDEFLIGVPGLDELIQRAIKVNERMKFSTPEHEAEVHRLREEKRKRDAGKRR